VPYGRKGVIERHPSYRTSEWSENQMEVFMHFILQLAKKLSYYSIK